MMMKGKIGINNEYLIFGNIDIKLVLADWGHKQRMFSNGEKNYGFKMI